MKVIMILTMLIAAPVFLCSGEKERAIEYKVVSYERQLPEPKIPMNYYYDVAINAYINNIPLWVADRLIWLESGYRNIRSFSTNQNGSYDAGIMQINSTNYETFGRAYNNGKKINPYDTKTSIKVALAYLGDMCKQTGSLYGGVCAYNCGLSRVMKDTIPERTKKYAKRILG